MGIFAIRTNPSGYMNWLDIAWIVLASASATLGLLHLFIWRSRRSEYGQLLFFALTSSIAVSAAFELMMMRSATPQDYATALQWAHVPVSVAVLSMVAFVRVYFEAGRTWLAVAVCVLRLLALALNFMTGVNLNFSAVTALDHATLPGGADFSVPVGTLNPWWMVAQIDNLLLLTFLVDASISLWRRGNPLARRRAWLVGGGLVLCVACVVGLALSTFLGALRLPTMVAPAFLAVAVAMGYELGADTLRAAQLARDLRDSERRSELAAQAARLAMWSWDTVNGEFWMNAMGRALFDLPQDERPGLDTFLARIHAEDRDRVHDTIAETVRSGGAIAQLEFRIQVRPGTTRWIATRGEVERRHSAGALLRAVSIDISERRRVEREVTEQRNELAHLSRVAALGEMAGALAHEINQPLMAILSNARAAQRFMASENFDRTELRAIVADIVEDDKRAGEVIHRLRALLHKGEVQRSPIDVNNVVAEALRLTRNELMNRGVAASTELASNLPLLLGDSIQLQQVLLNLVMNSCDAMDGVNGSHQLVVRTRVADGAGVEVSVSDSGRGIPVIDLERIFEPFVTSKEHGMGLGLSICRTIVAAHGGRLWAESVDGRGATMRFALPGAGNS